MWNHTPYSKRANAAGLVVVEANIDFRHRLKFICPALTKRFGAACRGNSLKTVGLQKKTVKLALTNNHLRSFILYVLPAVKFSSSSRPGDHLGTVAFIFRIFGLLEEGKLSL